LSLYRAPVSQRASVPQIRVLGAPKERFRDLYHRFLRFSWPRALLSLIASFLLLNVLFAGLYTATHGIYNARPGSYMDAFFFSVQTMATIGYGEMHPVTPLANFVVVLEAIVGVIGTALATGLLFAKFSVSNARIVFSRYLTIAPMDGVPTLHFRLGNERSNEIVEATLRVTFMRHERTREGVDYYRMYDLTLLRERTQAFTRSWTALHRLDAQSPLHGLTPEMLERDEIEIYASVIGTDDISLQAVHARHRWEAPDILFGARHVDILTEDERGQLTMDLRKFHEIQETAPSEEFPFPRSRVTS
jgi:inward rectifier potassium channel